MLKKIICKRSRIIFYHRGNRHTTDYWTTKGARSVRELPYIGTDLVPCITRKNLVSNRQIIRLIYFGNFYGNEVNIDAFIQNLPGTVKCELDVFTSQAIADVARDNLRIFRRDPIQLADIENYLSDYDASLLIMGSSPGIHLAIPTKLYDYLSFGLPIVKVIPDEAIAAHEVIGDIGLDVKDITQLLNEQTEQMSKVGKQIEFPEAEFLDLFK